MVQTFQVVQCFNCFIFQVDIVKKAKKAKWTCKMCNEQQTLKKSFFIGSSQECREHVQASNKNSINLSNQLLDELPEFDERVNVQPAKLEVSSINTSNKYDQFFEDDGDDDVFQGLGDVEKNLDLVNQKQSKYSGFSITDFGNLQNTPIPIKTSRFEPTDKSCSSGSMNSANQSNFIKIGNIMSSKSYFANNSQPNILKSTQNNKPSLSANSGNTHKSYSTSGNTNTKFNCTSSNPSYSGNSYKSFNKNPGNSNKSSYQSKNNRSSYNRAPAPLSLVDFHKNSAKKTLNIKPNSSFKISPNSSKEQISDSKAFKKPETVTNPSNIYGIQSQKNEIFEKPGNISTQSSGIFKFKVGCSQPMSSMDNSDKNFSESKLVDEKLAQIRESLSVHYEPGKNEMPSSDLRNNYQNVIPSNSQFTFKSTYIQNKRLSDSSESSSTKKSKWAGFEDDFEDFDFSESDLRQLESSQM